MNTEQDLREIIVHRSNDLPIAIYQTDSFYYHWHEEYEFLYVKEQTVVCIINGQQIMLKPGMGMLIHPGELHMMDMTATSCVTAIVVHPSFWSTREDAELFDGRLRFQQLLSPDKPAEKKILDTFDRIVDCFDRKLFGYEFSLRMLVGSVFAQLLEKHMYRLENETGRVGASVFSAVLSYVHENYMQEISLESLVQQFHYSKSYLIRLFKQNVNLTPVEYIKRYRIDKAKDALVLSNDSILDIAISCGFQNVSYFIRTFRQYTGVTPGMYRQQSTPKRQKS